VLATKCEDRKKEGSQVCDSAHEDACYEFHRAMVSTIVSVEESLEVFCALEQPVNIQMLP